MNRLLPRTLSKWPLHIGCVAGLVLALGGSAQSAPSVVIELPRSVEAPAVLEIRDLAVPAGGAAVTVRAMLCYFRRPERLTTLFVLRGWHDPGYRNMRAAIDASPDLIAALQNDPNATLTLTVCRRDGSCRSSGPLPVEFER